MQRAAATRSGPAAAGTGRPAPRSSAPSQRQSARTILSERKEQLDLMAEVLVERETVDREELAALLENRWDEYLVEEAEKQAAAASAPELEAEPEPEEPASDRVTPTPEPPPSAPPVLNA